MDAGTPRVLCLATQGVGSGDHERIAFLLEPLRPRVFEVQRHRRTRLPLDLSRFIADEPPDVIVLEGTGVAGGVAVMRARIGSDIPYVVSSGDAVAPFVKAFHPPFGPLGTAYEHALYRLSAGFIGWSPYLVGRGLHLGAPRAMTAAHYGIGNGSPGARYRIRERWGIPQEAVVFGIAGRIQIDPRNGFSYGVDLIRALRMTTRSDLRVLVVGDGEGLPALRVLAGEELGRRVVLAGGCSRDEVADYLAAMDIGSLSQSTDLVGALRYTTKLPEYLAAGLPVVSSQIPAAYDLDTGWLWRLPGDLPWGERYISALAELMATVSREDIAIKRACVPGTLTLFDASWQQRNVCAFVVDAARRHHPAFPATGTGLSRGGS